MKTPDCMVCRGACCETFVLPGPLTRFFDMTWLSVRSRAIEVTFPIRLAERNLVGARELPARCPELTEEGLCGIYSSRPFACAAYEPGSAACVNAIQRLRTPEQQAEIIGTENP